MILKTTSVFFILLANFILLAHDVVPHHHHKGLITFDTSDGWDDENPNEQPNKEHKHSNDNHSCVLKQSVIVPSNSVRFICGYPDSNENHFDAYSVLFSSNTNYSTFLPFITITHKPYLKSHHPNIVNCSLGLRAPPII